MGSGLHLPMSTVGLMTPAIADKCGDDPIGETARCREPPGHTPAPGDTLRTLGLAGLGLVVALAAPATALAQNQHNSYSVTASVTPEQKGSKAKPVPATVKFGLKVDETNGLQPAAVKRYTIGFGGLKTNGKHFKTCKASQMHGTDRDCNKKALVGTGTITNFVYADNDPSGQNGGFLCEKTLHVWNAGHNRAVPFVGGDPNKCGGVGNLAPIPAKFVKFGSNGQALRFDVPKTVLHPISGLTVAVREVTATIKRQTVKVKVKSKGKTKTTNRGFFESVSKKHPVQATFL